MRIKYAPAFLRALKKLPPDLLEEAKEKIHLFMDPENHKMLHVHKLTGRLNGQYSFRVNYKTRIVFYYISKEDNVVLLTAVGDHDVYNN